MPDAIREVVDLLVTKGLVIPMEGDGRVIKDGAVAVRDGKIVALGRSAQLGAAYHPREMLDASGQVVMPGLVNAHTHAATTVFRGLADDRPLAEWLERFIWPAEQRFVHPETVYWATLLAIVEMIRGGVTAFMDMYFYEEAVAEAATESAMRVVLGEVLFDHGGPTMRSFDEALTCTRDLLERYCDHPRISICVQPHSTYTVSPDNLIRAKALADEYGARFGLHASETAHEVADVRARTGHSPVRLLDHLGMLDEQVVLFHGVHLDPSEIALLAERGAGVVHCPEANLKLASGIAPLPAFLSAGVRVGLGTDGPASNNDLDMWGEIQMAAKIHRGVSGDSTAVGARAAVALATQGSAAVVGLGDRVGSLELGKRADMILVDLDRPHLVPMYDAYSHLAYAVGRGDVTATIVDGRVLMKNREVLTLDEERVVARVREIGGDVARWLEGQWHAS